MLIFYFTSTGNSLAVAKRILDASPEGGELVSIPQAWDRPAVFYEDYDVGFVFPVYSFGLPSMVKKFIEEASWSADYTFAVATYGNLPGAVASNTQDLAEEHGKAIDYAATLLMVDNYLPLYDMEDQIAAIPKKKTEEGFQRILGDILAKKRVRTVAAQGLRAASALFKSRERLAMSGTQAKHFVLGDECAKCGICSKVCPAGNISNGASGPEFSDKCLYCLGCVHACPEKALRHAREKSAARWRHPEVSLEEIILSNCRI
jgi:ferredoxin/flavodoxin